jgi:hypothetical protein
MGKLDNATANYDAALKLDPESAETLYGRGIAKLRKGDKTGNDDIVAAKAIQTDIAEEFIRYGVKLEDSRMAQP